MSRRSVYIISVWLFTILMCSCEIYYFVSVYLSYSTTTKLTIRHSDMMRIPTIVSCTQTDWTGTNLTQFFHKYMQAKKNPVTSVSGFCYKCEKTGKLFGQGAARAHDHKCSQFLNITEFTMNRFKCLSLEYYLKEIDRFLLTSLMVADLYTVSYYRLMSSFLSSNKEKEGVTNYYMIPYGGNHSFIDPVYELMSPLVPLGQFAIGGTFYTHLTYQRRQTQLLPPPYDTNCRDYERQGLHSPQQCLNDCMGRKSSAQLSALLPSVQIFSPHQYPGVPLMHPDQMRDKRFANITGQIDKSCHRTCRQKSCASEHFQPISTTDYNFPMFSISTLFLQISGEPDIVIQTKAEMQLTELLLIMLNTISMWTAFCPLELAMNRREGALKLLFKNEREEEDEEK